MQVGELPRARRRRPLAPARRPLRPGRARASLDRGCPPLLTTPAAARRLRRWGFDDAAACRTWESGGAATATDERLAVEALPGVHARGVDGAGCCPPVMGSLLEQTAAGRRDHPASTSAATR